MKKKSLLDVAVLATVFAIFLTSSFDLVGSIKVMGFTIRTVYLFVLFGAGLTLYRWIRLKELILPEGFLFLGIWTILMLAFIPNSPLVIRNVGYGVWLLLNVSTVFFVVNFMNRDNMEGFIRVYLVSFFALSLLGIVQYITPQVGLPPLVVEQWWVPDVLPRVNGFTYEPSFFATYLLFGMPAMLILLARGKLMGIPPWLFYTMLGVDVAALMVCSSRMGILLFFVFLAGFMVSIIVRWIRERRLGLHLAMSFAVPLFVAASVLLIMDMRLRQVNKDGGYASYLLDTGWKEKDITKGNSFKTRIQAMEKTFDVFQKNPVIGVSLGGIAPWIATTSLNDITSNDQVKPFEGINVPLEVLAASGVFGFVVFCIYLFQLCRPLLKKGPDSGDKDYYIALFWGFALGFIMLVENQNILRSYVWAHIALMAGVIHVLGRQSAKEKKGIAMANNYRKWSGTRRLTELVEHVVGRRPKIALAGLHMKALAILVLIVVCAVPLFAQTVLIDPNGKGGFENGTTFSENEWTVVNDNTNKWVVGAATKLGGLRGAYISNDGASYDYLTQTPQVSHFYRDVTFPAGETIILLRFHFKGGLAPGIDMQVFLTSTDVTPVAGTSLSANPIGNTSYSTGNVQNHLSYAIPLPSSLAGTTKRLVFSWRNYPIPDPPFGSPRPIPAAIDNIELVSEGSVTSNGTGGGNASSTSTWAGDVVPGPTDNVMIRSGDIVNANIDIKYKKLVVSGVLEPESGTPRTIEATSDVIVDQGGIIRSPSTGSAFHKLIFGGNFFNNGIFNGSTNNGQAGVGVEFTASTDQLFSGTGPITDITSITVNSATSTATVLIEPENLTVQGLSTNAPGFLNLTRGGARLNFRLESVVFTSASPTIPSAAALWVDNPNLIVKGQNSTTTVAGTLRVSNGTFNVGFDADDCLILVPNSTFISEGGAVNVTAALGVTSPSNSVKVNLTGGTVTVATVGNSSPTFASLDFGFSSLTTATSTAGTIVIQNANSAVSGPGDYRAPGGFNITGGTLQLGNATTTAASIFRISGRVPNLVIDQTVNPTVKLAGATSLVSSTTIQTGAMLDLNGNTLILMRDLNITGGTFNGTATGSALWFGGTTQQTFANSGTLVDDYVRGLTILNSSGATPSVMMNNPITIATSLNLTFGSLGGPGAITLGNSLVTATTTVTVVNGSMLTTPTFNPGATFNMNYNTSLSPRTTGPELPSIVGTLTMNNVNGVILNATTTAQKLTLTNGTLTTATSTALVISGTNPTDVTGGSSTSYVKGPLSRSLPPSLASGTEYPFPIGKNSYNPVSIVDAVTNASGTTMVRAEVFEQNPSGTAGTGLGEIDWSSIYKVEPMTLPDLNIQELKVKFSNRSNLGAGSRIGKSETSSGTFNSIGGSVSGNAVTSGVINSLSYFAIGITSNTFSGTYTVGSSGANYTTLTAAIDTMKAGAFTGPVVLSLLDASYPSEAFPIILNQIAGASAANTLTIRPAPSNVVTISGASTSGIFKLDGADYVTIDGSNKGTNSRDLSITNTDFYSPVIWLSSQGSGLGAKNNTIKNLILAGGLSQASSNVGGYGILGSGTSPVQSNDGADNDNNTIQNNFVKKVRYGIVFRGASSNSNDGNSITSNLVGPPAFGDDQIGKSGIVVQHQSGVTISNNEVRTVGAVYPQLGNDAASEDRVGIGLGGDNWLPISTTVTNATVTGNIVHDIIDERTRSAVGILVAGSGTPSNNVIANNFIYNVRSNGTLGEQGAGIGIFTGNGDKVVFNSIRMEGDIDPVGSTTGTGSNVGIRVSSASNLTLKNNIISVDLTSNTGTLNHYALVAPSSTFFLGGTGSQNYNNYSINASNTQMQLGGIGTVIPYTATADLATWQTRFTPAQDANSKSFAPDFTSATDLHLNLGSVNANYIALPIAGVITDIDGQMRSTTAPYKGADENTIYLLPVVNAAPSAPISLVVTDSSSTTVTIKWRKNNEADFLRYRIYRSVVPSPTTRVDSTTAGASDTSKTFTGLTNDTRYYFRVSAVDSAGNESGYSNEVSAVPADRVAPAAPQNLVLTDSTSTKIGIKWRRSTAADFLGFRIYRGTSANPTAKVDSTMDTTRTFTGLTNGTRYYLRVTAVDSSGNESAYSNEVNGAPNAALAVDELNSQIPKEYSLSQNFPNPFNPSTVIRYGLPTRSLVKLEIYNMLGQSVALLADEEQDARYYEQKWQAPVSSGLYFYRLQAVSTEDPNKSFVQVRKMLMLK